MTAVKNEYFEVLIPPLPRAYTYKVPQELSAEIQPGCFVQVPLGPRKCFGYVVAKCDKPPGLDESGIRDVLPSPRNCAAFNSEQLELFSWMSDYYSEPLSEVLDCAIPKPTPKRAVKVVTIGELQEERKLGHLQQKILEVLKDKGEALPYTKLVSEFGSSARGSIKSLEAKGMLNISTRLSTGSAALDLFTAPDWAKSDVALTERQQEIVGLICEQIDSKDSTPTLLHGVTGSGKTEVYLDAIQHALQNDKSALVIVPEIALTPQLIDRFAARLGAPIAVLHSQLSHRKRWESWDALLQGKLRVCIGARSAIFAPVVNPGLIVVDEEHDGSYKQSEGMRYNARDLAVVRAKLVGCPVVLGSATPSLETFRNGITKKYHYQPLLERHFSTSPIEVQLVDLCQKKPWDMASKSVSSELFREIEKALAEGGQVFILYNRRGFANYLQCDGCGTPIACPHCDVTLTFHRTNNKLCCHYCNFTIATPNRCPEASCKTGQRELLLKGSGTERVVDELAELFPSAVIERFDRDSVKDPGAYRNILDRVRDGKIDILVGTQMIAKGHDLPGVVVVGIVDCDVGLHMPDFRAGERVYQLLTQAAGRAGRGDKSGKVILQTRVAKHPSLLMTRKQDFLGFAKIELQQRKDLNYPPYSRILRILASSENPELPRQLMSQMAESIKHFVKEKELDVKLLGPTPAPIERLNRRWRWHILLKSQSIKSLHHLMSRLKSNRVKDKNVRIAYDLDPQDLL